MTINGSSGDNPPPNNLPAPLTPLIGRAAEVAAIRALLLKPEVRLVTVTGPGGIGKTRLSVQVGQELLPDFSDGVFFVALAPLHHPDLVLSTTAQTLGVRSTSAQKLAEELKAQLRHKRLLLILDNFENVLPAAPLAAELLEGAPHLKILVTSREMLHLSGEHEFVAPPLSVPDLKHLPPSADLLRYDSVRIFVERAQAVNANFTLNESNAQAVAEICFRLDGLPLAIELAAARSKLLPPALLLARLKKGLAFTGKGPANLPARQQTLNNTIGWSYDMLDAAEKRLFRKLAAFVGGFSLEAAEVVCADQAEDLKLSREMLHPSSLILHPADVLPLLSSLLDKSLLKSAEGVGGERRLIMLETIRAFALDQLEQSGEAEAVRHRHLLYYLEIAEATAPELEGLLQRLALERLAQEIDNLRAALQGALQQKAGDIIVRLCEILLQFWYVYGQPDEIRQWLEAVLDWDLPARVQAPALDLMGYVLSQMQSDYPRAQVFYERAVPLWRELEDLPSLANALVHLGLVFMEQGDFARARDLYEESIATRLAIGDRDGAVEARSCLGTLFIRQGDFGLALKVFEEDMAWVRERGRLRPIAYALDNLGMVALYQGRYDQARAWHEQALKLWQEAGDLRGVSLSLNALGPAALYQGETEQARTFLVESLKLRRDSRDRDGIAWNLERLAEVAVAAGGEAQMERAAKLWGAAEALREAISGPLFPAEQARQERPLAAARAQLSPAQWAAAWVAGRGMSLEKAVAYALEESKV